MPDAKSAQKGSAKKKLSKAEKEKLKHEEEERLALEEEDAKILAAEEARLQKIREKEEAGERKKIENEETRTRKIMMEELDVLIQEHKGILLERRLKEYVDSKWARYMRCDGSPDPTILGEINTYINLKAEDRSREDTTEELKKIGLDLVLIDELEYIMEFTPEDHINERLLAQYRETVGDLQALVKTKLDVSSHNILLSASELVNPETSNLQYYIDDPNIRISIWGNLAKNPRTKHFEFPEIHFSFDIPKVLTLTDCAYWVLWCKFDHYSCYCKTYHPRVKVTKDEPDELVNIEEDTEKEDEEGKEDIKSEEEGHETLDVLAALKQLDSDATLKPEDEPEQEEVEEEVIEDFAYPPTPDLIDWEDFDEYDDVIDLRAFGVIGGVFHFDLMQLPPQPKNVKTWVITQLVTAPELQYLDYVAEPPAASATQGSDRESTKKEERPPITISIKLPSDVSVFEEPLIARWDEKHKYWSSAGFEDIDFKEVARTMTCKTTRFGTMAMLQDVHINMPFQSWEIRPRAKNHCKISIIAAIIEIELEIKGELCCLIAPEGPEYEHLANNWMKPTVLIKELKRSGINLFPSVDSSKYVSIHKKHPLVEERIYFEMALTSSVMAYSWSKWNGEVGEDKFVFQGMESLTDETLSEEELSVFVLTKKKVEMLKMKELDTEEFIEERHPDTEFACDLYHFVQDFGSDQAIEMLHDTDVMYIECVRTILSAMRFLTYA